jgi:hypothetical protein
MLPIRLNVPVWVKGGRTPTVGDDERPDGNQNQDTIVEASSLTVTFFVIEVPNVRISHLSLRGARELGPDGPREPARLPLGVSVVGIADFALTHLRMERVGQAIRSEASSGTIRNNYLSADSPIFLSGGPADALALVFITNNRVIYRVNGIAFAGASMLGIGTHLQAWITDNDVVTTFANSGPTTPAALRVSPFVTASPNGNVDMVAAGNLFAGPAKFGILVHAGQPERRDSASYTGTVIARFADNVIDAAVATPSLITFTNARAVVYPCELNPTLLPGPACENLPAPPVPWEYLTNARYDLRHAGELGSPLLDHPRLHPVDGYPLGNVLVINREPFAYGTFVVVP